MTISFDKPVFFHKENKEWTAAWVCCIGFSLFREYDGNVSCYISTPFGGIRISNGIRE